MVGIFKMMERRLKFNPNYRASMFWLSHKKRNDEIDRYLANTFNWLKFLILFGYLNHSIYDARIHLSINRCSAPLYNPKLFPNPKILATRHLTPNSKFHFAFQLKTVLQFHRQSNSATSPLSKSTPNCLWNQANLIYHQYVSEPLWLC